MIVLKIAGVALALAPIILFAVGIGLLISTPKFKPFRSKKTGE